jgi:phage terminase Nu1 subunit (DNA packaging protein)
MGQILFTIYDPPEKGMPFLAVRIDGVKTKMKTVWAIAAKTRADAEKAVEDLQRDLTDPHWRERARLRAAYATPKCH